MSNTATLTHDLLTEEDFLTPQSADELINHQNPAVPQEAYLRSAISRSYYARSGAERYFRINRWPPRFRDRFVQAVDFEKSASVIAVCRLAS